MRLSALFVALVLLAAACDTNQAGKATPTGTSTEPSSPATASPTAAASAPTTEAAAPQPRSTATPPATPPPATTTAEATPAVATPSATPASGAATTPTATTAPPAPAAPATSTPAPPAATPSPAPSPTPTTYPSAAWRSGEPSCPVFPASNWWNLDVSAYPVHPRSDDWVASIGVDEQMHPDFGTVWQGSPIGIPYVVLGGPATPVPVAFDYASESDPGPYPIPPDVPIEAGSDAHVLVVDDVHCLLYELFAAHTSDGGSSWQAGSGAVFDLSSNTLRPDGWTSADAAGLSIFAGLVRYEEVVQQGRIDHALRFTARRTQRAFIHPATHWASSETEPSVPPMGARFRMRADYDCSSYSHEVQVICDALKRYGMFLADNGSDWYLSGAPDPRWDDDALRDLKSIPGSAFEVVDTGERLHSPASP